MLWFLESAVYLGGNLVFFCLLLIPALLLLAVSVLYILLELTGRFRSGWGP